MRRSVRFRRVLVVSLFSTIGASALVAFALMSGSGAATSGPVLDHFECYTAAATTSAAARVPFPATPAKVSLRNNFAMGGFSAAPGAVQMQCNPAQQTASIGGHSVTSPITNADGHLLCRSISPKGLTLPSLLTVTNQFGAGALKPTAVRSLCLPSWTNATTPANFPSASSPPNLDAYTCYTVVHPSGTPAFSPPASVKLKDQFGTVTTAVGAPDILCLPTTGAVSPGHASPKIVNASNYSVCFAMPAVGGAVSHTVYDKNQFGVGAVKTGRSTQLCAPSVKAVPPPTTTMSTTTTTIPAGLITSYTDPSIASPIDIVEGSDGAMWFTNYGNSTIGRITTDGKITAYYDSSILAPDGICAGPDGALWFTNAGNNTIGRITTAGVITSFTDPSIAGPYDIAAGSDGALWFSNYNANTIGRITTAGVVTSYFDATISHPDGIGAGPDGALWFANTGGAAIGRLTTGGTFSHFADPRGGMPYRVAAGTNGNEWFTNAAAGEVGYVDPTGLLVGFTDPTIANVQGIWKGPDGSMWFANYYGSSIGRVTTSGVVTRFSDPSISYPLSITAGPDDAMWFTNPGNNTIGRITAGPAS